VFCTGNGAYAVEKFCIIVLSLSLKQPIASGLGIETQRGSGKLIYLALPAPDGAEDTVFG